MQSECCLTEPLSPQRAWIRGGFLAVMSLVLGWGSDAARGAFTNGLINVDFGVNPASPVYSGAGIIGSAGDFWNGDADEGNALKLATGVLNHDVYLRVNKGMGYESPGVFFGTAFNDLMTDALFVGGSDDPATITISGLSPNTSYELFVYAGWHGPTQVTVNSDTKTAAYGGESTLAENVDYVHFASESADFFGQLKISSTSTYPPGGGINGLQIRPVPEPGTTVLVIFVSSFLACFRRR